jgi:excisionase family DNA binding protein
LQSSQTPQQEAPTGGDTPAEADIETLGETMQVNGTRMFRVKAVAEMFDVSVSTIYRAIAAGQLFALKVGSGAGAVRIPEYAITAFEELCADLAISGVVVAGVVSGEVA